MNHPKRSLVFALAVGALLPAAIVIGNGARASVLTYDIAHSFSGPQPNANLNAVFTDIDNKTVDLTLAFTADQGEWVDDAYFNFAGDVSLLTFTPLSGPLTVIFGQGADAFPAGPDGLYDILLDYQDGTFPSGVVSTIQFTSTDDISTADFDELSAAGAGLGPFKAAAHVQNVGGVSGVDSWLAPIVPEPSSATAWLVLGLAGLSVIVWRRLPL